MEPFKVGPFTTINTRSVYTNPWISVREDEVIRPDGKRGIFGVIEMLPGSSVLPLSGEYVYLAKEFKYGIGKDCIEVFSGALNKGESPLAGAKRELQEELQMTATEWVDLGRVDPFTTIVNSPNYMFLAKGLLPTAGKADDGEIVEVLKIPFDEAVDMVYKGKITHAASCVIILKAFIFVKGLKSV